MNAWSRARIGQAFMNMNEGPAQAGCSRFRVSLVEGMGGTRTDSSTGRPYVSEEEKQ